MIDPLIELRDHRTLRMVAPSVVFVVYVSPSCPAGWMGNPHAMWSAGNQATGGLAAFYDADVLFKPDVLRRAVAYAEAEPPTTWSCFTHDYEAAGAKK